MDRRQAREAAGVIGDVAIDVDFACGDLLRRQAIKMDVGKPDVAVALEADGVFGGQLAVLDVFGIEHAVVKDFGKRIAQEAGQHLAVAASRMLAAAGKVVVVDVGMLGIRIVLRVVDRVASQDVADDLQPGRVVVGDFILEDFDVVHRQEQHARAGGDIRDARAGGAEIRMVVRGDLVVKHADAAAVVQVEAGQVEHQDAAAIVGGVVVEDVGVERVLDLDAGHVLVDVAILHHDPPRLSHVDAGVGRPANNAAVDQHVFALHGIDAVRAVGGLGLARPRSAHMAEGDVLRADDLDGVAPRILDGEILDHEIVASRLDPLRSHVLVLEREDRRVHPFAADGDVIRRDLEVFVEIERACGQLDDVARNRLDQIAQEFALGVRARLHGVDRGGQTHAGGSGRWGSARARAFLAPDRRDPPERVPQRTPEPSIGLT